MGAVKQWAFTICTAMVICAVLSMIVPKGGMQKIFQITLSAFTLCAMLSPFVLSMPQATLQIDSIYQSDIENRVNNLQDVIEKQSDNAASAQIEKIILSELGKMGINSGYITINFYGKGQNNATGQIEVQISLQELDEQKAAEIKQRLENTLGLKVEIII